MRLCTWVILIILIIFYYSSGTFFFFFFFFEQLLKNNSCEALMNTFIYSTSPNPLLYTISLYPNITVFKCTKNLTYFEQHNYNRYNKFPNYNFHYKYLNGTVPSDLPHTCQVMHLPVRFPASPGLDETNIFFLLSANTSLSLELSATCSDCFDKGRRCDTFNGHAQCSDIIKGIYNFFFSLPPSLIFYIKYIRNIYLHDPFQALLLGI
ncbi:hypothetical protein Hanom_Chr15g01388041 [Helianthus anomalus]